ncbi:secreted RxLR effector protein 161-like [Brassica napus]|uniref:secreted RxLR effector protein 161-like n=1 Tax=Brassica napus TaxID=3708 RepID=UPI002078875F|nr:secreted RxLR effector protein 161-like [Brassica napus]
MEMGLKLAKSEKERDIDATNYRKIIGCFRSLLHTRPDLSYCIGVLSWYMANPKESHGIAIKQCLRYLQGTTTLGLNFGRSKDERDEVVGYSDSSYNTDPDDGRSQTYTFKVSFYQRMCEKELLEVEHVPGSEQKADVLTKASGRVKYKEMRDLIGIQDLKDMKFKLKEKKTVEVSLKKA